MYDILKRLYDTGKLPKLKLLKAVTLNWITSEEYKTITGEDYE